MEEEIDPYEKQLFAVFRSCDNKGTGTLNRDEFSKLCDTLQLEENHRNQLCQRLDIKDQYNIKFYEFRDALLTLLADLKSSTDELDHNIASPIKPEITPKFTFGGKKYGRRSRPASTEKESEKDIDSSNYDKEAADDVFDKVINKDKYQNSVDKEDETDMEIETLCKQLGLEVDKVVGTPELISLCNTLAIPNSVYDSIHEQMRKYTEVENNDYFTYGRFFKLMKTYVGSNSLESEILNRSLSSSYNEDGMSNADINSTGCINYDTLVYMLENAGINEAGIFLNDLGISPQFEVNLSELATQLQEELINVQRCMNNSSNHQINALLNPHLIILQASVVVSQAQIKWYRSCMEQIQCERDKIRNDLLVANDRASLLAQEVDDNHAKMENSVQQKLKLLEQKHADQIKKLTHQWSTEREQLANQNIKLEKQLEQLLMEETRLRAEVASLKQDYEALEKENRNLLDQLLNAENFKEELEREIQRLSLLKKKVLELESSNEQAISFLEKMNQLQNENIKLRDKNDELVVELENVALKQLQNRSSCSKRRGNSPLGAEENSDTEVEALFSHRMYPKVRKFNTEKDLTSGFDSPPSNQPALGGSLMTQCESGVEADVSTSNSSLDRLCVDTNNKIIPELQSRVVFLENVIRKYHLKVPDNNELYNLDEVDNITAHHNTGLLLCRATEDLEKQCEALQCRLDQVQKEILKLLSGKRACSEENCGLKQKIHELMKSLPDSVVTASSSENPSNVNNAVVDKTGGGGNDDGEMLWSNRSSSESETLKADSPVLGDAEALKFVENEGRRTNENRNGEEAMMVSSPTTNVHASETVSVDMSTRTNSSCSSSMKPATSCEGSEMEWRSSTSDEGCEKEQRKSSGWLADDETGSVDNISTSIASTAAASKNEYVEKLELDYRKLADENTTLKEKCEELNGCLDLLRSEYEQCEDYWTAKLDEERKIFDEEQRISDEKLLEIQMKIQEYSEMYTTDQSMSSASSSKLPPIAENDKLEMEVNYLQEEFRIYKKKMELENKEKQAEIERLMKIISLYEYESNTANQKDRAIEQSLESIKSDKTYTLENPSSDATNIPIITESASSMHSLESKSELLKQRKRQLKKDCGKLSRERDQLIEQMIKIKSSNNASTSFNQQTGCVHLIRQHNAEVSRSSALFRLRQQEMRNRSLRNMILQHQKKFARNMKETSDQHAKELSTYKNALASSQETWQSLQETVKKQGEQITMSNVLVKELYCENSQLMATIHQLEQQHLDCSTNIPF